MSMLSAFLFLFERPVMPGLAAAGWLVGCGAFEDTNTSSVMILNYFFIMSSLNRALLVG